MTLLSSFCLQLSSCFHGGHFSFSGSHLVHHLGSYYQLLGPAVSLSVFIVAINITGCDVNILAWFSL